MDNRIPASQILRDTADKQEKTLENVNTFKPGVNEYGATNPEVTPENGNKLDVKERAKLTGVNFYGENNQYKSPE